MNSNICRNAKADQEVKEDYLHQVHRYFLMTGIKLFSIIYESKDTNDFMEWVIEADPNRITDQQQKLDILNNDINNGTLQPRLPDCEKQTGVVFRMCPYRGKHGICVEAPDQTWPTKTQQKNLNQDL